MKKVFLDTDVIIDFLTKRLPYSSEAMRIFEYSARGQLQLFASSLSFNNINYIVTRLENKKKAAAKIKQLMSLVEVLAVGKSALEKSLLSGFKDFEDGIQNFCAKENGLTILITRNVKDYSKSDLSIQTPKEFLAGFEKKEN